ncbi:hypothetical protein PR048_011257 [Dryococelus australis]|uniref:Uncharacterized protein n=1 Tax=Dryococelus australis TaxID=614101 RepID=A0ABQ9HL28_9NEOP|nr:hypothetical protein PR048_011257 [Dryococelus australis]
MRNAQAMKAVANLGVTMMSNCFDEVGEPSASRACLYTLKDLRAVWEEVLGSKIDVNDIDDGQEEDAEQVLSSSLRGVGVCEGRGWLAPIATPLDPPMGRGERTSSVFGNDCRVVKGARARENNPGCGPFTHVAPPEITLLRVDVVAAMQNSGHKPLSPRKFSCRGINSHDMTDGMCVFLLPSVRVAIRSSGYRPILASSIRMFPLSLHAEGGRGGSVIPFYCQMSPAGATEPCNRSNAFSSFHIASSFGWTRGAGKCCGLESGRYCNLAEGQGRRTTNAQRTPYFHHGETLPPLQTSHSNIPSQVGRCHIHRVRLFITLALPQQTRKIRTRIGPVKASRKLRPADTGQKPYSGIGPMEIWTGG